LWRFCLFQLMLMKAKQCINIASFNCGCMNLQTPGCILDSGMKTPNAQSRV
jgi:hypothetical protein